MKEEILARIRQLMQATNDLNTDINAGYNVSLAAASICELITNTLEVMAVMVESDRQPTMANNAKSLNPILIL